jgi:hypothetical protein
MPEQSCKAIASGSKSLLPLKPASAPGFKHCFASVASEAIWVDPKPNVRSSSKSST